MMVKLHLCCMPVTTVHSIIYILSVSNSVYSSYSSLLSRFQKCCVYVNYRYYERPTAYEENMNTLKIYFAK